MRPSPGFSVLSRSVKISLEAFAILLAELWRVPTINGYSSFQPPGYDLCFPESPDYPERIRRYIAQIGLTGVCGLDMAAHHWSM